MKIALTSTSNELGAKLSPVFGRCPFFVIVETQEGEIKNTKAVKNPAVNQRGGAGPLAAQKIGDSGAEIVISGNIGPRAFDVLERLGIEAYQGVPESLETNIDKFFDEELEKVTSPGPMGVRKGGQGRGRGFGSGSSSGR